MTPREAAPLLPPVAVDVAADVLVEPEPDGDVAVAEPAAEPVADAEPEDVEVAVRVTPYVQEGTLSVKFTPVFGRYEVRVTRDGN